ncbi:MAG: hypothetical protein QOF28_3238 [Actinomycetota bacterium]|jgi:hypothetical protein|nr:hypothetical protein [Actinomycetota bacterium]
MLSFDGPALDEQPPSRVVGDARGAFRDAITDGTPLRPIYDSWDERSDARVLLFRCPGYALLLVCRRVPGGFRVSGAMLGRPTSVGVVIRRPGRPFLRIATTADLRLRPVTIPPGLVSVVAEVCDGGQQSRWQSEWLKL